MFGARKVKLSKWESSKGVAWEEISPDAVTSDLRTTDNTLSLWGMKDGEDEREIRDVVLALASGFERLDAVDLAWIPLEEVEGVQFVSTWGRTPVEGLGEKHLDARIENLGSLCRLAEILAKSMDGGMCASFSRKDVLEILEKAIEDGRLRKEGLHEKLRKKLGG